MFYFPYHIFPTQNQKISQHSSVQKPAPWNLDRIDEHDWPLDGEYRFPESDGTGIDVYVMDSGIRASHEEFGGRASCGLDVVEEDGRNDCFDGSGHGKCAHLLVVKVHDCFFLTTLIAYFFILCW